MQNRLSETLARAGLVTIHEQRKHPEQYHISVSGNPVIAADWSEQELAEGELININGVGYQALASGGMGRLALKCNTPTPETIDTPVRVHAGLHKCLTEYSKRVYSRLHRPWLQRSRGFRHHFHRLDAFYHRAAQHSMHSLSGQSIDCSRFRDIRIVRFIRDPRDLMVSAYHYHKRCAEPWCDLEAPQTDDWMMVNGTVPKVLGQKSLTQYLNDSTMDEGLHAEMEFRQAHFDSMMQWPENDDRILLFRYEDIIGREVEAFKTIARFLGLPWQARIAAAHYAKRFRADKVSDNYTHVRNASSGQWRDHFSDRLRDEFSERHRDLLQRYDYPLR